MTGLDLISRSLRVLGVLAAGETAASEDANDALVSLNAMLDSWGTERLVIYSPTRETFTLVIGTQTYTFGSGGTFNSARPQAIETASLQIVSGSTTLDLPVDILNRDEFEAIGLKSLSGIPTSLYCDYAYATANVKLWPVPDVAYNLVLSSWKVLSQISTLATTVSLPPGYERAIVYNLAGELAPEYGKQLSPKAEAIAMESKGNIKRMNKQVRYLTADSALTGQASGSGLAAILSGGYSR